MSIFEQLFSLKGKRALITGASSGIGRSIAVCYAEAGATVGVHGTQPHKIAETIRQIEEKGGSAHLSLRTWRRRKYRRL